MPSSCRRFAGLSEEMGQLRTTAFFPLKARQAGTHHLLLQSVLSLSISLVGHSPILARRLCTDKWDRSHLSCCCFSLFVAHAGSYVVDCMRPTEFSELQACTLDLSLNPCSGSIQHGTIRGSYHQAVESATHRKIFPCESITNVKRLRIERTT